MSTEKFKNYLPEDGNLNDTVSKIIKFHITPGTYNSPEDLKDSTVLIFIDMLLNLDNKNYKESVEKTSRIRTAYDLYKTGSKKEKKDLVALSNIAKTYLSDRVGDILDNSNNWNNLSKDINYQYIIDVNNLPAIPNEKALKKLSKEEKDAITKAKSILLNINTNGKSAIQNMTNKEFLNSIQAYIDIFHKYKLDISLFETKYEATKKVIIDIVKNQLTVIGKHSLDDETIKVAFRGAILSREKQHVTNLTTTTTTTSTVTTTTTTATPPPSTPRSQKPLAYETSNAEIKDMQEYIKLKNEFNGIEKSLPLSMNLVFANEKEANSLLSKMQKYFNVKEDVLLNVMSEESLRDFSELQRLCDTSGYTSKILEVYMGLIKNMEERKYFGRPSETQKQFFYNLKYQKFKDILEQINKNSATITDNEFTDAMLDVRKILNKLSKEVNESVIYKLFFDDKTQDALGILESLVLKHLGDDFHGAYFNAYQEILKEIHSYGFSHDVSQTQPKIPSVSPAQNTIPLSSKKTKTPRQNILSQEYMDAVSGSEDEKEKTKVNPFNTDTSALEGTLGPDDAESDDDKSYQLTQMSTEVGSSSEEKNVHQSTMTTTTTTNTEKRKSTDEIGKNIDRTLFAPPKIEAKDNNVVILQGIENCLNNSHNGFITNFKNNYKSYHGFMKVVDDCKKKYTAWTQGNLNNPELTKTMKDLTAYFIGINDMQKQENNYDKFALKLLSKEYMAKINEFVSLFEKDDQKQLNLTVNDFRDKLINDLGKFTKTDVNEIETAIGGYVRSDVHKDHKSPSPGSGLNQSNKS